MRMKMREIIFYLTKDMHRCIPLECNVWSDRWVAERENHVREGPTGCSGGILKKMR